MEICAVTGQFHNMLLFIPDAWTAMTLAGSTRGRLDLLGKSKGDYDSNHLSNGLGIYLLDLRLIYASSSAWTSCLLLATQVFLIIAYLCLPARHPLANHRGPSTLKPIFISRSATPTLKSTFLSIGSATLLFYLPFDTLFATPSLSSRRGSSIFRPLNHYLNDARQFRLVCFGGCGSGSVVCSHQLLGE